jgi:hypothetical protein
LINRSWAGGLVIAAIRGTVVLCLLLLVLLLIR